MKKQENEEDLNNPENEPVDKAIDEEIDVARRQRVTFFVKKKGKKRKKKVSFLARR